MVTWGRKETAGDREQIDSLRNVSKIQATVDRFAALCKDGSVVTWPHTKGQLLDIREIQRNELCFAAIKVDGTLVTWGKTDFALDPTRYTDPPPNLQGVRFLAAGPRAFAAVLNDRIVTWGDSCVVGDDVLVQAFGVKAVKSNGGAFAGLREDGTATRMLETLIQALCSSHVRACLHMRVDLNHCFPNGGTRILAMYGHFPPICSVCGCFLQENLRW